MTTIRKRTALLGTAVCLLSLAGCGWSEDAGGSSAVTTTPVTSELRTDRYGSRSSASTPDGAAWAFAEGLRVRVTGATRLSADDGSLTRDQAELALIRIDFSYTNDGAAVHVSEGLQLPVRLLYGAAQDEAEADGGYIGSSDRLTLKAPTSVAPGTTVTGAVSFAVPAASTDALALLVVEPRRYTEHLFTDIEDLL